MTQTIKTLAAVAAGTLLATSACPLFLPLSAGNFIEIFRWAELKFPQHQELSVESDTATWRWRR